jgi:hypothetical protein
MHHILTSQKDAMLPSSSPGSQLVQFVTEISKRKAEFSADIQPISPKKPKVLQTSHTHTHTHKIISSAHFLSHYKNLLFKINSTLQPSPSPSKSQLPKGIISPRTPNTKAQASSTPKTLLSKRQDRTTTSDGVDQDGFATRPKQKRGNLNFVALTPCSLIC